ncbi:MAG: class I SAM-dependent methyltransferase [Acidobacteria bacterium]|nr:class I SAM-dependent methyltransferase [Acidobacteriota bacterium]
MNDPATPPETLARMKRDWDARAAENARYYVATRQTEWKDEEWWESGRATVREQILNDMINICQGLDPKSMRVLEIGCGAGRITRALAEVFGMVYAVDISAEMIRQARHALRDVPNAFLFENNGKDLDVLGNTPIDFAFSIIVFQHIPSREVIENYVREVHRLLRPGGLFKFQVQGDPSIEQKEDDTWVGAAYSDGEACALAERCGFEPRHRHGAGDQYFWLWFFKR